MYKMDSKVFHDDFVVTGSFSSKMFVNIYPYIHRIMTIGERVKMYFWRKKRDSKRLIF